MAAQKETRELKTSFSKINHTDKMSSQDLFEPGKFFTYIYLIFQAPKLINTLKNTSYHSKQNYFPKECFPRGCCSHTSNMAQLSWEVIEIRAENFDWVIDFRRKTSINTLGKMKRHHTFSFTMNVQSDTPSKKIENSKPNLLFYGKYYNS